MQRNDENSDRTTWWQNYGYIMEVNTEDPMADNTGKMYKEQGPQGIRAFTGIEYEGANDIKMVTMTAMNAILTSLMAKIIMVATISSAATTTLTAI